MIEFTHRDQDAHPETLPCQPRKGCSIISRMLPNPSRATLAIFVSTPSVQWVRDLHYASQSYHKLGMNKGWNLQDTLYMDGLGKRPATWTFRASLPATSTWARDLTEDVFRVTWW